MTDIEQKALKLLNETMAEYGRIHIDGSRSGGQPIVKTQHCPNCESQAAEIERLQVEAKAQFDRGYYDGCSNPIVRNDVSFRELAAVLYQKSAEFQVVLTVADSYTLAAEVIAFLQEQSK